MVDMPSSVDVGAGLTLEHHVSDIRDRCGMERRPTGFAPCGPWERRIWRPWLRFLGDSGLERESQDAKGCSSNGEGASIVRKRALRTQSRQKLV